VGHILIFLIVYEPLVIRDEKPEFFRIEILIFLTHEAKAMLFGALIKHLVLLIVLNKTFRIIKNISQLTNGHIELAAELILEVFEAHIRVFDDGLLNIAE
jgi:hypothetical protein